MSRRRRTTNRATQQLFDELEDMIAWFERNPPRAGMSQAEAARVLGLTLPTTSELIDAAFRRAALASHPDRGGSNEMMAKINQARAVLRGAPSKN